MSKFIRNAHDILHPLSQKDKSYIDEMNDIYREVLDASSTYRSSNKDTIITLYKKMGDRLQEIVSEEFRLNVFSFSQPMEIHGEISRLIAKLRNVYTPDIEFTYYMQRAFEHLFNFGFQENIKQKKNYLVIKTPVTIPVQNYALHKLPNLDEFLHNTVMCVMLRGALLPSMIMAKEIQEYSSTGYVPNFALFRISRNHKKDADNMEYIIQEESSYYDINDLEGKDLIFADPMNATGGSILTAIEYIKSLNIHPKSIKLFHAISTLQGALQIIRAYDNVDIYTLWLDPILNKKAYIMPGLGDAGDRLNGIDTTGASRNILQLIAYYGQNVLQLYRAQIQKIEETILGKME